MSARTKLNGIYLAGVVAFAALLGGVSGSWLVFLIVAVAEATLMIHTGDVRLQPSDNPLDRKAHFRRNHAIRAQIHAEFVVISNSIRKWQCFFQQNANHFPNKWDKRLTIPLGLLTLGTVDHFALSALKKAEWVIFKLVA